MGWWHQKNRGGVAKLESAFGLSPNVARRMSSNLIAPTKTNPDVV